MKIAGQTPLPFHVKSTFGGSNPCPSNVTIAKVKGRERSAFAARDFAASDFVCKYASCMRSLDSLEDSWSEHRNEALGILSYCLDPTFQGKVVTFDVST